MAGTNASPGFACNPDHRITVEPYPGTVTVRHADVIVASSKKARLLREGNFAPVYYIPFDEIYFEHLQKTGTRSHCPFKGDATYWRVTAAGEAVQDAMWAYETPFDEMSAIRDHGAFYANRVTIDAGVD